MSFFTEREGAVPPRSQDVPTGEFIRAVVASINGLADRGWLARGWPRRCPDDPHPTIGTNGDAFWQEALTVLNFTIQEPRDLHLESEPLKILNLLEFVHRHIAQPRNHDFHGHFTHWHLDFNGPQGKTDYQAEVNGMFTRFGLAFEMRDDGSVMRLPPEEVRPALLTAKFQTGDGQLDQLLEEARARYLNPNPVTRKEGLERLWDAFERLKTVTVGADKKAQITALIEAAYTEADARTRLDREFTELTGIGNAYNIRHFETNKLPIPDDAFVDWLFPRCYSAIHNILNKTGRVRH